MKFHAGVVKSVWAIKTTNTIFKNDHSYFDIITWNTFQVLKNTIAALYFLTAILKLYPSIIFVINTL